MIEVRALHGPEAYGADTDVVRSSARPAARSTPVAGAITAPLATIAAEMPAVRASSPKPGPIRTCPSESHCSRAESAVARWARGERDQPGGHEGSPEATGLVDDEQRRRRDEQRRREAEREEADDLECRQADEPAHELGAGRRGSGPLHEARQDDADDRRQRRDRPNHTSGDQDPGKPTLTSR